MNCNSCGTDNPSGNNFCLKCGAALAATSVEPQSVNPYRAPQAAVDDIQSGHATLYAGFWRRLGAYLIDCLIFIAASTLLATLGAFPTMVDFFTNQAMFFVPWLLYQVLLESSPLQGTLGKLALGIKVTDLRGERISFLRALGRNLAEIINSFTLLIGYIMVAFTARRQGLHDMIASTLVVERSAAATSVATAGRAKPMSGWGIAGIVVLCLLPVLGGIVAAISIPAYQDYTIRAQVTEGLALASPVRAAVAESYAATGRWPTDNAAAGVAPSIRGTFVEGVVVNDGSVLVTYNDAAHASIASRTLGMRPWLGPDREVSWQCGSGDSPADAEASPTEPETTVPSRYLPSNCR